MKIKFDVTKKELNNIVGAMGFIEEEKRAGDTVVIVGDNEKISDVKAKYVNIYHKDKLVVINTKNIEDKNFSRLFRGRMVDKVISHKILSEKTQKKFNEDVGPSMIYRELYKKN